MVTSEQNAPELVCGADPVQANITSFAQRAHEKALTEQLIQQKKLLLEKQQQFEQLQNDHEMIIKHVQIIEREWENSNAMLETLMEQLADAKKKPSDELTAQLHNLQQQVEEANMSKSVMKHHCRELNERNEELNALIKDSLHSVEDLKTKAQQQADVINQLRAENVALKQQNISQAEKLKRQEGQLTEALHGYYSDVMNKHKKLSKNLPR